MYCKKCGNEISDGAKFCKFCGAVDVKIKDAKIITVELTINIPIYGSETDSEDFVVIKIGNSWYLDPMNFSL